MCMVLSIPTSLDVCCLFFFFFQAEDGIRDLTVTGVQTCALPISRVRAQARQLAGRERDPARVAERLTHWVYGHVEKRLTVSLPSAVQVLEQRRGDCNEHTVLYVALARAAGLPARAAAGLVYLDSRFYYHAWPEVWLGDWVAVDPTLDQFPADATHLRFVVGGLARQVELVRMIGKLKLEVL